VNSVFDVQPALENMEKIVTEARKANIPVIFSQELHRTDLVDFGRELDGSEGVHCLEGTPDIEIVDSLTPVEGEYLIQKRRYSCFFGTDLAILLKGLKIDTLVICGFLTDVCVHYTCADAHQHDYYVRVVRDAVRGSSKEAHHASLNAIQYLQRDALTDSEEVMEWLQSQSGVSEIKSNRGQR
jgi:biuret amidohydrolase